MHHQKNQQGSARSFYTAACKNKKYVTVFTLPDEKGSAQALLIMNVGGDRRRRCVPKACYQLSFTS